MIIERSMQDQWLSNTYLLVDEDSKAAAFIDAGGPIEPLVEIVDRDGLEVSHILLTHHHFDHVAELDQLRSRYPAAEVLAHPLEQALLQGVMGTIEPGDELTVGNLKVKALHTPGHTAGMLSFLVNGNALFTGDTLFKGSVGGVRAPGHTTFTDLKDSIMTVIMELPAETVIYPGHTDSTTVAEEWGNNEFIRIWRGLDEEGTGSCEVLGEQATLILNAPDYDGGTKAWVRWPDGADDIVPGSALK